MKKNILLYALLGLMAVVTSCSKTDETEKPTIPAADLAVWNKVQAFKARMANPLKDGDPLTVDSAVWYIETTLNCTYGDASYEFTDMHTDSAFTTLTVENGQVDMVAVTTAYNQLLDSIRQHYYGLTATDKQFVFANVELIPTGLKSSEVTLKVTSGVGEASTGFYAFGPNDYWYYGAGSTSGYCDGPLVGHPNGNGKGADTEIIRRLNQRRPVPGGDYYYIPEVTIMKEPNDFPNDNDPTPDDNIMECYLYKSYNWDYGPNPYHDCLPPNEMNFYLSGLERIVYNSAPMGARPVGKDFISVTIEAGMIMFNPSTYYHFAHITYGQLVMNNEPPIDL